MSDDITFEQLKKALGFEEEDEEKALERTRKAVEEVKNMAMGAGMDEAEALKFAAEFLSGHLRYGSGQGGLHAHHFSDIVGERAFYTQRLGRVVLDVRESSDGYHLEMTVLAVDEDAAEQLATVAKKLHQRRDQGEPS